jgi:nicotinate-nucleotide adenylyltransferase
MRLGVMGGTFDPIHYAHLFVAEEARAQYQLDRVLFIPCGTPAHKSSGQVTPASHRLTMTQLAIASNPAFSCSLMEVKRTGVSYTVDTLRFLKQQHPEADLFLIVGADILAEIQTWRQPEDIVRISRLIVAERPGCCLGELCRALPATYTQRMLLLCTLHLDISSTEIRRRVQEGRPIRYLTPDPVVEYIATNQLYRVLEAK